MNCTENKNIKNSLLDDLKSELDKRYGPMIGGKDLWKILSFSSAEAFRQAVRKKLLPIPVFKIENRRGKFALTTDIAKWLAELRSSAF